MWKSMLTTRNKKLMSSMETSGSEISMYQNGLLPVHTLLSGGLESQLQLHLSLIGCFLLCQHRMVSKHGHARMDTAEKALKFTLKIHSRSLIVWQQLINQSSKWKMKMTRMARHSRKQTSRFIGWDNSTLVLQAKILNLLLAITLSTFKLMFQDNHRSRCQHQLSWKKQRN